MSFNPYEAPAAEVRDEAPASPPGPQKRPLWIGLLGSAVAPALIMVAWGMLSSPQLGPSALPMAAYVGAMSVGIAGIPTLVFGLPCVLLLRRMGWLRAGYVLLAAALAGAITGFMFSRPGMGVGFGLASGLAMIIGAGIPFQKPRADVEP